MWRSFFAGLFNSNNSGDIAQMKDRQRAFLFWFLNKAFLTRNGKYKIILAKLDFLKISFCAFSCSQTFVDCGYTFGLIIYIYKNNKNTFTS